MAIGSTILSIGSLLCASIVLFTSQTFAVGNPRFRWLNKEVYHTLKCYRNAKGFPGMTSPKGALAKAIGLAPVRVDSLNEQNLTMRYNMCISTLEGFRKAMDTIVKTEKNLTQYRCSQSPNTSTKLTDKLNNLCSELRKTVDALYYQYTKLSSESTPSREVKTFDAGKALKIAHKTAKTWLPGTKGMPRQNNPQSLMNLVILHQLWSTTADFTRYNTCPVPFLR